MLRHACPVAVAILLLACSKEPQKPSSRGSTTRILPLSPASAEAPSGPKRSEEPTPRRPYNVVLLIIDAMRADMPWAGYDRNIMPWLTGFQKKHCVTYTQAHALSSYTAKSVIPILVGKYPSEMTRDGRFYTRWPDKENLFISERLQKAGHRTLSGQTHPYYLPLLGNSQGFDDYRVSAKYVDLTAVKLVTSPTLTALAKEMLSAPKNVALGNNRRFFAYFHYMDPHKVYQKHPGHPDFGDLPRDRYDNELHWTDYWVGQLIDWAREQPWGKSTAFIITADHGESFGEHGHYGHAYELWESLVKVPLIVCVPDAPARKLEVRRSHVDLAPTVADLMGLDKPDPPFRGKSLIPEVFGKTVPERPIIVDLPRCDTMDRRRAVIVEGWKIIAFGDDAVFKLYDLSNDPGEKNDLSEKQPQKLAEMKTKYLEISKTIPNVEVVGGAVLKGAPPGRRW